MYVKRPAPGREPRLDELLDRIRSDDDVAYKAFDDAAELEALVDRRPLDAAERGVPRRAARASASAHPRFTLPGDATTFVGRDDGARPAPRARRARRRPAGHAHRPRRHRQDAAGPPGRRRQVVVGVRGGRGLRLAGVARRRPAGASARSPRRSGCATAPASTVETLAADLATRSLLLVVDNFEHVMGAADVARRAAQRDAPRLKIAGDQPRGAAAPGGARVPGAAAATEPTASACSTSGRRPCGPTSASTSRPRRRRPDLPAPRGCAAGDRAGRGADQAARPRGAARAPRPTASTSSSAAPATSPSVSGPCATRSSGATTCSTSRTGDCSPASGSSSAASPLAAVEAVAAPGDEPRDDPTCSTCSPRSSTRACCGSRRRRASPGSGCSR